MSLKQIPEKADILIGKIRNAFPIGAYPGDDKIVYDNTGDHLECNEVAAAFRGKKWNEVSLKILRHNHEGLFFFTPQSYRYYLPAYMLASIQSTENAGNIPSTLIFSLTVPEIDGSKKTDFHRRVEGFTPEQKKAIKEFLEYMSNYYRSELLSELPKAALSTFWQQFK